MDNPTLPPEQNEPAVVKYDVPDAAESKRAWSAHSLSCCAVRHPSLGHWCGYVAIPAGHKWHGEHYDAIDVTVHGGLTYASDHAPNQAPDGQWWVGFDCAHAGDRCPEMKAYAGDVYRDIEYVANECGSLAAQIIAVGDREIDATGKTVA